MDGGMHPTSRAIAAALSLAALSCVGGAPGDELTGALRRDEPGLAGTLRRVSAPAWLTAHVCGRAAALDGCPCGDLADAIAEEVAGAGADPLRVLAVIEVESSWDPGAVSSRDARGLMQLRRAALDDEARRGALPSADPHDPVANVRAGIRYLARLERAFGDPELALVAYNAGPGRLLRHLRSPDGLPERFLAYPRRVREEEAELRRMLGGSAGYTLQASGYRPKRPPLLEPGA
jgi:soluble lytic murein transglycosylase-like protein